MEDAWSAAAAAAAFRALMCWIEFDNFVRSRSEWQDAGVDEEVFKTDDDDEDASAWAGEWLVLVIWGVKKALFSFQKEKNSLLPVYVFYRKRDSSLILNCKDKQGGNKS